MLVLKQMDRIFWMFLPVAIFLGFLFPDLFQPYEGAVIYLVMGIMGLLFLKVDIVDVLTHIKKPGLLIYVSFVNLIFIPVLVYLVLFRFLPQEIAMALFLLAALPSGVSSAVFTDIMEGRTSLSLTIVIVTNLLATFTIPALFWILFKTDLDLDIQSLFINLLMVIVIPFIIAKFVKRVALRSVMDYVRDYLNFMVIVLLSIMLMISVAFQADTIMQNFGELAKIMGILYVAFFVYQMIGYFSVFWHGKGEKVAVSNSCMIMNNVLGIVLAVAFFSPKVVTIVILSIIPWSTMIIFKTLV